MRLNTDKNAMLQAAEQIASEYSNDQNVVGVLVRRPIPDDPDFPQTCDVELALVANDLATAEKNGYVLVRHTLDDVLTDVCAIAKEWLLAPVIDPLAWILSLGDPRAFEVFKDYSRGELTGVLPTFKRRYLASAVVRVPYWLREAKRRLDAALDLKLDPVLRLPEAAYALVYITCTLLDSSGRSFAGTFLKLPRNLRSVNSQLAEELNEYLPAADKGPSETAKLIPVLANQLASEYPPATELGPREAAEVRYNLSPLEVEYRSFVASEIGAKDRLSGLWYARAWATYLVSHHGTVVKKVKGFYAIPSGAYSTWREILGNGDRASIESFVAWVDEMYSLCVEACEDLKIPTSANSGQTLNPQP